MTDLDSLLRQVQLVSEQEAKKAERQKMEKENEAFSLFMADFQLVWAARHVPTVTTSNKVTSVRWGCSLPTRTVSSHTLSRPNDSYFSKTAGLSILSQGPAIVLELPGRSGRDSYGEMWDRYSDLTDLKLSMHPQELRKMLPTFPPTHLIFSEAYKALDAYFRVTGEAYLQTLENRIAELEHRQAALQERYDNLPPPMEALAAVPLGRIKKQKSKEKA